MDQERRNGAYGRTQDQQRGGSSAAGEETGKEANHSRDWRGSARCCHGSCLCSLRVRMCGVHGCSGLQEASAECVSYGCTGGHSGSGGGGLEDAQRCDQ